MNEWTRYRLQDFVPFTEQVYFRLMERMGETFWPLQLLMVALGGAALVLVLNARLRLALVLVAPVWVFVAVAFFMQRYAQLNWAGHYMGYAFCVQAALLVLMALSGRGSGYPREGTWGAVAAGGFLALFGLIGLPLITLIWGGSWYQTQVFGIHPDPTAIATLGLVMIGLRGLERWVAAIIPALWMLVSGLTLLALSSSGATGLMGGSFTG